MIIISIIVKHLVVNGMRIAEQKNYFAMGDGLVECSCRKVTRRRSSSLYDTAWGGVGRAPSSHHTRMFKISHPKFFNKVTCINKYMCTNISIRNNNIQNSSSIKYYV